MKIDIFNGETGEYCWTEEFFGNTCKIKEMLLDGYAVHLYDNNNYPIKNYVDENIGTDLDGFAFPIKK